MHICLKGQRKGFHVKKISTRRSLYTYFVYNLIAPVMKIVLCWQESSEITILGKKIMEQGKRNGEYLFR